MEWFKPLIQVFFSWMLCMVIPSNHKKIPAIYHSTFPQASFGCSPKERFVRIPGANDQIPLLPGWGHYHFETSSANDSTRIYFDQGLSLYYSYHPYQAFASFIKASRFDTNSAICYWGQALAKGPFYNALGYYSMPGELPAILELMQQKFSIANAKEKDLILAMEQRYGLAGAAGERKKLNRSYAEAMKKLISKYPEDLDMQALYIDAVMLEHPWEFWNTNGSPKSWTNELIAICEQILKVNARHPGAMHYFIHLTEASRDPGRASSDAENLRISMPGVPHMVHMASHVYERTGRYSDGVAVNDQAFADDDLYQSLNYGSAPGTNAHYLAVQAFCAINGAMLEKGMPIILSCGALGNPSSDGLFSQYLYSFPILGLVRMGKWQSIIESQTPSYNLAFSMIIYDFAMGMAYLRSNAPDSANYFLHAIDQMMTDNSLMVPDHPFSPYILPSRVAREILGGEILSVQNNIFEAQRHFEDAIKTEDSIIYSEPKKWLLPARQYYGTRLLEWKRLADAEKEFQKDLIMNPGNGWSLTGLYQCELAKHNSTMASQYKALAEKAFDKSELKIQNAVF